MQQTRLVGTVGSKIAVCDSCSASPNDPNVSLTTFGRMSHQIVCVECGFSSPARLSLNKAMEVWNKIQILLFEDRLKEHPLNPAEIEKYREVERDANTFSENLSDYREAVEDIGAWLTEVGDFIEDKDHEELTELECMWTPGSELDRLGYILRPLCTTAKARADGELTTPTTKKEK